MASAVAKAKTAKEAGRKEAPAAAFLTSILGDGIGGDDPWAKAKYPWHDRMGQPQNQPYDLSGRTRGDNETRNPTTGPRPKKAKTTITSRSVLDTDRIRQMTHALATKYVLPRILTAGGVVPQPTIPDNRADRAGMFFRGIPPEEGHIDVSRFEGLTATMGRLGQHMTDIPKKKAVDMHNYIIVNLKNTEDCVRVLMNELLTEVDVIANPHADKTTTNEIIDSVIELVAQAKLIANSEIMQACASLPPRTGSTKLAGTPWNVLMERMKDADTPDAAGIIKEAKVSSSAPGSASGADHQRNGNNNNNNNNTGNADKKLRFEIKQLRGQLKHKESLIVRLQRQVADARGGGGRDRAPRPRHGAQDADGDAGDDDDDDGGGSHHHGGRGRGGGRGGGRGRRGRGRGRRGRGRFQRGKATPSNQRRRHARPAHRLPARTPAHNRPGRTARPHKAAHQPMGRREGPEGQRGRGAHRRSRRRRARTCNAR